MFNRNLRYYTPYHIRGSQYYHNNLYGAPSSGLHDSAEVYLTDNDGAYLLDNDGAYLLDNN